MHHPQRRIALCHEDNMLYIGECVDPDHNHSAFATGVDEVLQSCNTMPFWATKDRGSDVYLLRMRSSHANAFYPSAYDDCVRSTYRILVNSTSGSSRPLGGIPINLYLSVSTVTVPSWRCGFTSWRICIPRTLLSGWKFHFMICANCGAIAVIASMIW